MKISPAIIKQIKKHQEAIGKERDALRKIQDEIDGLRDCAEEGYQLLEEAIDRLSTLT